MKRHHSSTHCLAFRPKPTRSYKNYVLKHESRYGNCTMNPTNITFCDITHRVCCVTRSIFNLDLYFAYFNWFLFLLYG